MTNTETLSKLWIIRDYLELVLDEDYLLYNSIQEMYIEITKDNIDSIIDMLIDIHTNKEEWSKHYPKGLSHFKFIRQEYSKHSLVEPDLDKALHSDKLLNRWKEWEKEVL